MSLNIKKLRGETRGCRNVIHFNNAGASLMADPVINSVIEYLQEEAEYGGYETANRRKKELEKTYQLIAELIHARPEEIALLENATAAWNMAFYAIDFSPGDRILTSVSEYASNFINYLKLKKEMDVEIEVIPNDEHGQTSVEQLSEMMDRRVKLISITHIPTNNGLVNPAEKIGEVAQKYDCLYLLDACQSVGQYPVDVKKIGCDLLSATGRKYMRAPRGTGFLYVNSERLPDLTPPFLDLHSAEWTGKEEFNIRDDAGRFENWESNYAGIIGLHTAVKYILNLGIENIWERVTWLAELLRTKLEDMPAVTLHDIGETKCGIVTFSVKDHHAEEVKDYLFKHNINVSVSIRNSTLIDMDKRNLDDLVRASVHYYNTEEEIGEFIDTLKSL